MWHIYIKPVIYLLKIVESTSWNDDSTPPDTSKPKYHLVIFVSVENI